MEAILDAPQQAEPAQNTGAAHRPSKRWPTPNPFLPAFNANLPWVSGALLVLAIVVWARDIAKLRVMTLYSDEGGVWVYGGIFPWNRGRNRVKWRNLEDAVPYTGFLSWLLNSHTVRVGNTA